MTRIRNRAAVLALPLALGALAFGASSASANTSQWGNNGSATCTDLESTWSPSQSGAELGTYCMQSVTGWIQIGRGASQSQAISCSNNATSAGLAWSTDGQPYANAGPWYSLGIISALGMTNDFVGWQTGGGGTDLSSEAWFGGFTLGSNSGAQYGAAGASVTNWGGGGSWQAALACVNAAGDALMTASNDGNCQAATWCVNAASGIIGTSSVSAASAAPVRVRDRTIDSADEKKSRAFLAREYALKKNVTRTDTRSCPAGMVRRGDLAYTVQEFPSDNKAPKWKNRSLVDVKMTTKGKNAGSVKMTLKRAKNPTVVQFQMRCGKR